jgi:nucleoside diphosphate kinase
VNRTILLVKPEAVEAYPRVEFKLDNLGIRIVQQLRERELDMLEAKRLVEFLHPKESEAFRTAAWNQLRGRPVLWLLCDGREALRRMPEYVGASANPGECAQGTLRRDFGIAEPVSCYDRERRTSFAYFRNGFYCPRDERELERLHASGLAFSKQAA